MRRLSLALFFVFLCLPLSAAPRDLLAGRSWGLLASPDNARLDVTPSTGLPGGSRSELTVKVNRATDPFYNIQAAANLPVDIRVGDRLEYRFWARAAGRNTIRAVIETVDSPWTNVCQETLTLTPQWKEYTIDGAVDRDYGQPLSAKLQVGASTGLIEFTGVKVMDDGIDPAIAEAKAAVQPNAVRARIRKYRMGDLVLRVVDADGRPMPHAHVTVRETRSAFLFGCNFFGLKPTDNSPQQQAYRDRFIALFNYATLPFYWGAFEPEQGQPQFDRLDAMIDWCNAHGITPKAHPLVWHEVYPKWAPAADPDATVPLLEHRVKEIIGRERDRVHYYDIVNEAANGAAYSPANGESLWVKRDGAPKVVETVLGWAKSAEDGSRDTFIYNDYETGQPNVDLWTSMAKDGKLPDVVGIQSHMHGGVWPMEQVWSVCERFARFGRPIHFTETTVLSGPRRPLDYSGPPATDWETTPEDEKAQADYVVQFYSLLFSHPSVQAITWWDFSDQDAWLGAPAGLLRKDMSPKPAYDRLLQLIRHDWWTNTAGQVDVDGRFRARAFYGEYEVTVDDGRGHKSTRSISFPAGSKTTEIVVTVP